MANTIPSSAASMNVPSITECYALFDQYKVPGTIRAHCGGVFQLAVFLAQKLIARGYPLRLEVVKPFALLHDFMKAVVLERLDGPPYNYKPTPEEVEMHYQLRAKYQGRSETDVTSILLNQKYPEFAHLFLELSKLTKNPHAAVCHETKFIHYVDWRVLGNEVVPLPQRMKYIYQRYGDWLQRNNINWEESKQEQFAYEQQLFAHLPFTAEELGQQFTAETKNKNSEQLNKVK